RDVGNGAYEGDTPGDAGAAGTADLQAIEIVERLNRFLRQVPVLVSEIDPAADDVRAHFGLDLLFDQRARRPVNAAADHLHRLSIENRQLREVAVRDEAGHGPGAGGRHVDLA